MRVSIEELSSRTAQLAAALVYVMAGHPIAPDADVAVYARMEGRMAAGPVVVVSTTGVDGTMVWWYPDQWSADRNHVLMTACSRGVSVHTRWLHEIPENWLDDAKEVYRLLRSDPGADVGSVLSR